MDELIKQRQDRIEALKRKGVMLYPAKFSRTGTIASVLAEFSADKLVRLSGRIMAKRTHGKAGFADLRDASAKIQLYVKEDLVDKETLDTFQDIDIGDIIGVEGKLFKTRTAEPTVSVNRLESLAKAIRVLPEKWHGLKDVETRYRQRYLDLLANPKVKEIFLLRSRIVSKIREFLDRRGFLEVETPMMQPIPGGAAGRPFKTHHNVLDMDLYLRIAPELYLKRLLVAGFDKVYELNRSFRNEGISTRHNPEFTMLEVYSAYDDYQEMMRLTEELFKELADEFLKSRRLNYQGRQIDLEHWQTVSFATLMKEKFDINPDDNLQDWLKKLSLKGIRPPAQDISRSFVANLIAETLSLKGDYPVFVTDIFTELCPLAKKKPDNPLLSERFELFIADIEVANGYSELNDPQEQKERFLEDLKEQKYFEGKLDTDYIEALEYGMPPAGGLGIGIDRLVMLFADQPSIREVILFPQLKSQNKDE